LMQRRCGPGRVVAIEPDPEHVDRLETNLRLNHALGVHVIAAAAGRSNGPGVLHRHRHPIENSVEAGERAGATPVAIKTLDFLALSLPVPDIVKIHVPAGVDDVVRGASDLLATVRPVIVLEVRAGGGLAALDLLRGAGYGVRALDDSHVLAEPIID